MDEVCISQSVAQKKWSELSCSENRGLHSTITMLMHIKFVSQKKKMCRILSAHLNTPRSFKKKVRYTCSVSLSIWLRNGIIWYEIFDYRKSVEMTGKCELNFMKLAFSYLAHWMVGLEHFSFWNIHMIYTGYSKCFETVYYLFLHGLIN